MKMETNLKNLIPKIWQPLGQKKMHGYQSISKKGKTIPGNIGLYKKNPSDSSPGEGGLRFARLLKVTLASEISVVRKKKIDGAFPPQLPTKVIYMGFEPRIGGFLPPKWMVKIRKKPY